MKNCIILGLFLLSTQVAEAARFRKFLDPTKKIDPSKLQIRVGIIRHGLATSNVKKVIAGSLVKGVNRFGLIADGRDQVTQSIRNNRDDILGRTNKRGRYFGKLIIVSSPLLRTRQTAEIAAKELGIDPAKIKIAPAARERFYGRLEGKSAKNYFRLWKQDCKNSGPNKFGAESVNRVRDRMGRLILRLNQRFPGATVLIATHGDPGTITETLFSKLAPTNHFERQPPLNNADIWWFN